MNNVIKTAKKTKRIKALAASTAAIAVLTFSACATQSGQPSHVGTIDCNRLRAMDHSTMDHSQMTAEVHAIYQKCGIKMDMSGMDHSNMKGMDDTQMENADESMDHSDHAGH